MDSHAAEHGDLPTIDEINTRLQYMIARSRSDQAAYDQLGHLLDVLSTRYALRTLIAASMEAGDVSEHIPQIRCRLNRVQLSYDQLTPEMGALLHDIDKYCERSCETSFGVIEEACNGFIFATDSLSDALIKFIRGVDDLLAAVTEQMPEDCDTADIAAFKRDFLPNESRRFEMLDSNDFGFLERQLGSAEDVFLKWAKKITRRFRTQKKKEVLSTVRKLIKACLENLETEIGNIRVLLRKGRASLRHVLKFSFRTPRYTSTMYRLGSMLCDAMPTADMPAPFGLEALLEQYRQATSEEKESCIAYLKDYAVYYHKVCVLIDILIYLDPRMLFKRPSGQRLNNESWKDNRQLRTLILAHWSRFTDFVREKFKDQLNAITELKASHDAEYSKLIDGHFHVFTALLKSQTRLLDRQEADAESLYKQILYPLISEGNNLTFPLWPEPIFNYIMGLLGLLSGLQLRVQRSYSWDSGVKSLIREFVVQVGSSPHKGRSFKEISFNNFVKLEWLGEADDQGHGLPGGGPSLSRPAATEKKVDKKAPSKKAKKKKARRRRKAPQKTSHSDAKKDQTSLKNQQAAHQIDTKQDSMYEAESAQVPERLVPSSPVNFVQADENRPDLKNKCEDTDRTVSQVTRRARRQDRVLEGCFEPNFRILARDDHMVVARYWRGLRMGENVLVILHRMAGLGPLDQEACRIHLDPAVLPQKDDQPGHKWDIFHAFPEDIDTFLPALGRLLEPGNDLWRGLGLSEQRADNNLFGTGYAVVIGAKLIRGSFEHPTLERARTLVNARIGHYGCFVWLVRSDAEHTVYHRMFHQMRDLV